MNSMLVIAIALFVFLPAMIGAIVGGLMARTRPWSGFAIGGLAAALLGMAVLSAVAR